MQYLKTHAVSELLGISEQTLRKWRWEGKGPKFLKFGSRVMYRQVDIDAYVAMRLRSSTSDHGECF